MISFCVSVLIFLISNGLWFFSLFINLNISHTHSQLTCKKLIFVTYSNQINLWISFFSHDHYYVKTDTERRTLTFFFATVIVVVKYKTADATWIV